MAFDPTADAELQAKADQKCEVVQEIIRRLEHAMQQNGEEDRKYIQSVAAPGNPCFPTLIRLITEPKYRGFVALRCVVLRAVQIILHIAQRMVDGSGLDVGESCLRDLVGERLAEEALPEIQRAAEQRAEPHVACGSLLVLAELGQKALPGRLAPRLLELFVQLPDRADDLVDVVHRMHAWGGQARQALLLTAVRHPGGGLLMEVLLQVINRADDRRRLRALKIFTGCMGLLSGEQELLHSNDARVLVEILLREMPNYADEEDAFACHADCYCALLANSRAARSHRRDQAELLLQDLQEDPRHPEAVRARCAEALERLHDSAG